MRMRVSRDRVVGVHPKPHIWNQRPQFAYTLYNFYVATTTIKGSLHASTPHCKAVFGRKFCPVRNFRISRFPIDLRRRPYNTLALPCECVMGRAKRCMKRHWNTISRFHSIVYYYVSGGWIFLWHQPHSGVILDPQAITAGNGFELCICIRSADIKWVPEVRKDYHVPLTLAWPFQPKTNRFWQTVDDTIMSSVKRFCLVDFLLRIL